MSNVKKQNTLFRFISLRSPELSKKEDQNTRFIFHPDNETGVFFSTIQTIPAGSTKEAVLLQTAQSFPSYEKESELETLCGKDFYDTAEWISQNKSGSAIETLLEKIKGLQPLEKQTETQVWDQLFHQVITSSSLYIKEALMQVLVLQNILKTQKEINDINDFTTKLPSLLQAKVVIPKELFEKESGNTVNTQTETSVISKELLNTYHVTEAKSKLENYKTLLSQIDQQEANNLAEYKQAYDQAWKEYQKTVQPLWENYQNEYKTEAQRLYRLALEEGQDPDSLIYQPDIEKPEIPEFTFEYTAENSSSVSGRVVGFMEKQNIDNLEDAAKTAKEEIEKQHQIISKYTATTEPVAVTGDAVIPLSSVPLSNDLLFLVSSTMVVNKWGRDAARLAMYIQLPGSEYQVAKFNYGLRIDNPPVNSVIDGEKYESSVIGNILILEKLYNGEYEYNSAITSMKGQITFTNGDEYTFEINPFDLKGGPYTGVLKNSQEDDSEENLVPSGFGITQLGIADYKKVVSEVACYQPGEVSHIENIMAREFKEKSTKSFHQFQITQTESSEIENEKLSDTTSTSRFEMQTEISKLMQEHMDASVNSNVHYGTGKAYSFDLNAGIATGKSKEESNRQALTEAKEITQRAMERVVSKFKKETVTKITNEFTEENKHGFDNREGDHHVSGVYRFINAIYRNQIYNYGKRLMYEFVVPQPSKLHYLALGETKNPEFTLEKPIDPRKCGLTDFSALNELNYMSWAAKYGTEVKAMPEKTINISHSYSKEGSDDWAITGDGKVEIPENYIAKSYKAVLSTTKTQKDSTGNRDNNSFVTINGQYEPNMVNYIQGESAHRRYEYSENNLSVKNSLNYSLNSWRIKVYAFSMEVKCQLSNEAYQQWQAETFKAILDAYQTQLKDYEARLAEIKNNNEELSKTNPLFYRQIEQTALRKNCISYLLPQKVNADSFRNIGKDLYNANATFTNCSVTLNKNLEEYGSFVKFMEQAFEWDLMSYTFYPFYWGAKNDWTKLYQFDCSDPLFKSFMQSGLARVVVSVKPGFEDAVMHYIATGKLWNGGEIPVLGDPLYLSIVDELREQEYVVEETWETVVPTTLTGIQNSGVAIEASGLPCLHKDEGMGAFTANDKTLGVADSTETQA